MKAQPVLYNWHQKSNAIEQELAELWHKHGVAGVAQAP
jgi:hypothetical protein